MKTPRKITFAALVMSALTLSMMAADKRPLATQVPAAAARLPVVSRMPANTRLRLAIGLPLRNRDLLTNLLAHIDDRTSTNFHRYFNPAQFAAEFGPTEDDYERVKNYAVTNHLMVVGTYGNRALLDVAGSVADIEKMFQVQLGFYNHPQENRQFYAPNVAPTVDTGLPILYVSGLDNYSVPQPRIRKLAGAGVNGQNNTLDNLSVGTGSGTNGYYQGNDFRNAYVPGVNLKGAGQVVGLVEFDGYNTSDIKKYESLAGLPNVTITNILVAGVSSNAPSSDDNGNGEVALDIEMVISMAPSATLEVVEGAIVNGGIPNNTITDVMNTFASQTNPTLFANQISTSWSASGGTVNEQALMQMAMQGQTFFYASGDGGAPTNGINSGDDDFNYLTSVGGTELYMTNNGSTRITEQVWDRQFILGASSGYISPSLPIPDYQKGVNMTAVGGSSAYRNCPDVAMAADNLLIVYTQVNTNGVVIQTGKVIPVGGTSAAAPLWAAFTSLVNEQAANEGLPSVGFLNPALYAIGGSSSYSNCFHDITVGNDTNTYSANLFLAYPGYDLCTGWGSPNGLNLINALVGFSGPIFVDFGYTGGGSNGTYYKPFTTLSQGISAVANGGTIIILNGGTSDPTTTITKPMNINAQGGSATIVN